MTPQVTECPYIISVAHAITTTRPGAGLPAVSCSGSVWRAHSGQYLLWRAMGAKDGTVVLDEQLCEYVEWCDGAQRHTAVTRPHQVNPEHACQVRGAHLIEYALLRYLHRQESSDNIYKTECLVYYSVPCSYIHWTVIQIHLPYKCTF